MHNFSSFNFKSRLIKVLLGIAVCSLVVSCQKSASGEASSGGGTESFSTNNTRATYSAFSDFNCSGGWSNRDGALGLTAGAGSGTCDLAFPGGSGKYQVTVKIQTEFDGNPIYRVSINGNTIKEGTYPTSTKSVQCRCDNWRKNCPDRNVNIDAGVHVIRTGDIVQFYGKEVYPCGKHGAYAKWHSITFTPVN